MNMNIEYFCYLYNNVLFILSWSDYIWSLWIFVEYRGLNLKLFLIRMYGLLCGGCYYFLFLYYVGGVSCNEGLLLLIFVEFLDELKFY